jgi:multidrug resistance efflux pump
MSDKLVVDLADCTEYRQTLQARPPRIVHGTVTLLTVLVGTALLWSAVTEADLVVRAAGEVRPVTTPIKVFVPARGNVSSVSFGGRVVEVKVQPGAEVKEGDVLIRLDTKQLDNEIAKQKQTIRALKKELAQLDSLIKLLALEHKAARAKAKKDLDYDIKDVYLAKERQGADIHQATSKLEKAKKDEERDRGLVAINSLARSELYKTQLEVVEANAELDKYSLPVNEGKVASSQEALKLVEAEYARKGKELKMKRGIKQNEVQAAKKDLHNLELERKQAVIRAPLAGVVTTGELKVGDYLEPGKQAMEIAEQKGFRFELQVPTEEIAHLRVGTPARVRLNAYDYQRYGTLDGTVCFISPDSKAEQGQKTVTYLVRIDLKRDEVGQGEFRGKVKLGMAGQGEIVTSGESILSILLKKIRQTISLG